jgi:2-polyprenyl-6-methoxyphenol hydroxylase-like FAD-dependent oxidoreductase
MAEDLTGGHALVLGAGMAGCLAAAALAPHFHRVTVVERDRLTGEPGARRPGLPQAAHAHLLLGSGVRWIDALLPGTGDALRAAGAHRLAMPADLHTLSPHGWLPRIDEAQFVLACGRPLLDSVVRSRMQAGGRIEVLAGAEVTGLLGDARRVTGARLRDRDSGVGRDCPADLVVDATGATGQAPAWLAELGLPAVPTVVVDAGVGYATRTLRLGDRGRGLGAIYLQADPAGAGRGGVLLPIEDDRWMLSLSGVRGQNPPTDEAGFAAFVASLRHPILAEILAQATPLGPVRGFHKLANRWRRFERLRRGPEGFVALGDAARTFNPAYGHGMSVAAASAHAVRQAVREHGTGPGLARRLQRAVTGCAAGAWAFASGQDARYLDERRAGPAERVQRWYADRVGRAAVHRPVVTRALIEAYTLQVPPTRLFSPGVLRQVLVARAQPADPAPPFLPAGTPPSPAGALRSGDER